MGLFSKLKETLKNSFGGEKLSDSLTKTRKGFIDKVFDVFTGRAIDEELFEELEEILIQGDVGINTSIKLVENLRERVKIEKIKEAEQLRQLLVEEIIKIMGHETPRLALEDGELNIILIVGVNGVGKTTSIGKLAYKLKSEGKKVLLAAGDTFRAAAIDQLKIWGQRVGVDVISHKEGADPAAVVYDGIQAAKARVADVLIIDTAGRLHNKVNLMEELKKIRRIIDKEAGGALKEVLLVLDATTGQNALSQAKTFGEAAGVTGVILTKLDGTAKGGIVIGIKEELNLPVKLVGVGEKMEDLQEFNPQEFVAALFAGMEDAENEG
ncbi:MAG: signal recognition particle-docking protein FtsY [Clostridia bacterium]|nr:signal recognition particle-docking protein FtsY [Clostridia bacterium]